MVFAQTFGRSFANAVWWRLYKLFLLTVAYKSGIAPRLIRHAIHTAQFLASAGVESGMLRELNDGNGENPSDNHATTRSARRRNLGCRGGQLIKGRCMTTVIQALMRFLGAGTLQNGGWYSRRA